RIIDEVKTMPAMHDMYGMGFDPRMFGLSAFPAAYALELHHWTEAAVLTPVDGASDFDPRLPTQPGQSARQEAVMWNRRARRWLNWKPSRRNWRRGRMLTRASMRAPATS